MTFLNPALLWFAMGGLIPIIIHLLYRQKYRRISWAAMEFLLAALKKTQRRIRLENILLMIVRILIMILLAAAIARPYLREAPAEIAESNTHYVFLVDTSFSMGFKKAQNSALDVAKKTTEDILETLKLTEQDNLTLMTSCLYPEVVIRETKKRELFRRAVSALELSDAGSNLTATLEKLKEILSQNRNLSRKIYLLTDLQRVGWDPPDEPHAKKLADLLKEISYRENTRLYLIDVLGEGYYDNAAIVNLRVENPTLTTKTRARIAVDLFNFSLTPRPSVAVHLFIDGDKKDSQSTILPANAPVTLIFHYDFYEPGPHFIRVDMDPDYLDVDDRRYLSVEVRHSIRVLCVDGDPGENRWSSETGLFSLVLDPTLQGTLFEVDTRVAHGFTGDPLSKRVKRPDGSDETVPYDLVVLANVENLSPEKVERLEDFVEAGGGLFITLGNKVDKTSFNELFFKNGTGLSPAALLETNENENRAAYHLAKIDFDHPMFSLYKGKLQAALHDMVFYHWYRVENFHSEQVLACFDDNVFTPAFLEKRWGEGKSALFTSTLDHEWNLGWQGTNPYVVMMFKLAEYLASRPSVRRNLFIGDTLQYALPIEKYAPEFHLSFTQDISHPRVPPWTVKVSPEKDQRRVFLYYPAKQATPPEDASTERPPLNEGISRSGVYSLLRPNAAPDEEPLVIFCGNVSPNLSAGEDVQRAEGNLERMSKEEIRKRWPDFRVEFMGEKQTGSEHVDLNPPPSGLWKVLLYGVLGFLVLESLLAWFFGMTKQ